MNSSSLVTIIAVVSIVLSYLPVCIYLYKAKGFPRYIHILAVALISSVLLDSLGFIFAKLSIHTYWIFNVQDALQFFLLSWFYYEIVFKKNQGFSPATKYIFIPCTIFYLVSLLLVSFNLQNPISSDQNFMWTASAVIIIFYSSMYFNHLVVSVHTRKNLQMNILVWINSGVFYYFSFTILLFLLREYLIKELTREQWELVWSVNNINNIIKNVLIAIGLAFYADSTEI